jgi:hypothetical protein
VENTWIFNSWLRPPSDMEEHLHRAKSFREITMWYGLVRSYKDLNTAKFKVIHEMEAKLPVAPYDSEWEKVGKGKNSKLYLPFTHIEIYIPWVFFVIHAFVLFNGLRILDLIMWLVCND